MKIQTIRSNCADIHAIDQHGNGTRASILAVGGLESDGVVARFGKSDVLP